MIDTLTTPHPWAYAATLLGWLYSILAHTWPIIFTPHIVRHGIRQHDGYRFGRAISWQLPKHPALIIGTLVTLPTLATTTLSDTWTLAITSIIAGGTLACWITHPPGQRFGILENHPPSDPPILILQPASGPLRTTIICIGCGILPAILGSVALTTIIAAYTHQ